jgi:hypothetical protein
MFGSDSGFTPTDVGAEPFFSPEGPKMAIKLASLDFAPDGCECDPFFFLSWVFLNPTWLFSAYFINSTGN